MHLYKLCTRNWPGKIFHQSEAGFMSLMALRKVEYQAVIVSTSLEVSAINGVCVCSFNCMAVKLGV
jgi:hypothetical protein